MGLLVIPELDLGYHRRHAQDTRAYWQLRLSSALLHLDSPADRHPTEGSETRHLLQARVSIRSTRSESRQHLGDAYLQDPPLGFCGYTSGFVTASVLMCQDLSCPESVWC